MSKLLPSRHAVRIAIVILTTACCQLPPPASAASADELPPPILRITPEMHTAMIKRITVDAAETILATGSEDKTVRLWDLLTDRGTAGELLRTIRLPSDAGGNLGKVYAVALHPWDSGRGGGFQPPWNGCGPDTAAGSHRYGDLRGCGLRWQKQLPGGLGAAGARRLGRGMGPLCMFSSEGFASSGDLTLGTPSHTHREPPSHPGNAFPRSPRASISPWERLPTVSVSLHLPLGTPSHGLREPSSHLGNAFPRSP